MSRKLSRLRDRPTLVQLLRRNWIGLKMSLRKKRLTTKLVAYAY